MEYKRGAHESAVTARGQAQPLTFAYRSDRHVLKGEGGGARARRRAAAAAHQLMSGVCNAPI